MPKEPLTPVLERLNELSLDDLRKVKVWLDAKVKGDGDAAAPGLIYDAARQVVPSLPPYAVFAKMPVFAKYKKDYVPMIVSFVKTDMKPKTRAHKIAAYKLIVQSLKAWMESRNIPISANSLVNAMPNAITALNSEFPGYMRSGLLTKLLEVKGGRVML